MSAVVEFGFNASPVFSGVSKMDQLLQSVDRRQQQRGQRMLSDGRNQLALLEAQITGNKKEAASIQQRISLMERMRTIQAQTNVSAREAYALAQRSASLPLGGRGGFGGGRGMNLGMVSMQMQDVIVQAQMGTRWSTIIAQQGSQLASIFGPGGMLIGGIAAAGGLFYSMQQNGVEALQALKTEALDFDKSLRHLKVGGIMDMIDGMEKMKAAAASMGADAAGRTGSGLFESTARFFSPSRFENGKVINSYDEKRDVASELALKNEQGRKDLMDQIVKTAEEELRISQLLAAGRNAEAERLQREIAMRQELAKLDGAPEEIRATLQGNVRAKYAAENAKADSVGMDEAFAKAEKLAATQQRLDDQKKAAALDEMTTAQRISVLRVDAQNAAAEEAALRADFVPDAEKIIAAESRKVALQVELNRLMKAYKSEQEDALETSKREADNKARDAKQAAAAATTQRNVVVDTELEYKLLQAKAGGRQREADAIERQQRVLDLSRRFESQNKLDPQAALTMALQFAGLQDRASEREGSSTSGGRSKIIGFKPGQEWRGAKLSAAARGGGGLGGSTGRRGFGTLDDYTAMQRSPSQWQLLQQGPSQWDRLQGQHGANAARADAPANAGNDADNFLEKIISKLPPALAAALMGA